MTEKEQKYSMELSDEQVQELIDKLKYYISKTNDETKKKEWKILLAELEKQKQVFDKE
jgi:hypothetical protein